MQLREYRYFLKTASFFLCRTDNEKRLPQLFSRSSLQYLISRDLYRCWR